MLPLIKSLLGSPLRCAGSLAGRNAPSAELQPSPPQPRQHSRYANYVILSAIAIAPFIGFTIRSHPQEESKHGAENAEYNTSSTLPLANGSHDAPKLDIAQADLCATITRLGLLTCSDTVPSPAAYLHVMRLGGVGTPVSGHAAELIPVSRLFLDMRCAETMFRSSILDVTRYGLRYRRVRSLYPDYTLAQEAHPSQVMATFAELGVPLTTVLHVNDTPYTLK